MNCLKLAPIYLYPSFDKIGIKLIENGKRGILERGMSPDTKYLINFMLLSEKERTRAPIFGVRLCNLSGKYHIIAVEKYKRKRGH